MISDGLSIDDLASSAGLTRRGVRFYVQQKLLPPPLAKGRNAHYGQEHLDRLKRIIELQSAGHSLDEIRRILSGEPVPPPENPRRLRRGVFQATLMTRMNLVDGVELAYDAARFRPNVEDLVALRDLVQKVFQSKGETHGRDRA